MWWRMIKAIILSWLIGVVCGMGILIILQNRNEPPPTATARSQTAPEATGAAPGVAGNNTR